jgi:hypothetical protein
MKPPYTNVACLASKSSESFRDMIVVDMWSTFDGVVTTITLSIMRKEQVSQGRIKSLRSELSTELL